MQWRGVDVSATSGFLGRDGINPLGMHWVETGASCVRVDQVNDEDASFSTGKSMTAL
jgi:hypothetical protein